MKLVKYQKKIMTSNLIILIFFFNLILFLFHKKLSNLYNIYDIPDGKRKKHKKIVPLTGGLIIYLNISLFFFLNNTEIQNVFIFLTFAFVVGFLDDKYDLSPNKKLLFMFFIILINIFIDQGLNLEKLKFEFILDINLNNYLKILFPTLCVLIFINALNMFDGSNLQASLYSIFIFFILFLKTGNYFYIHILFPLICFSLLNMKNKSFLGDSGSIILGYLISISIITEYNLNNIFYCEEIFLLMFLPGVDMLRLFIVRSFNKRNPLIADSQHIHHLLKEKFKDYQCLSIIFLLSISPYILSFYIGRLFSMMICILIYTSIIFLITKNVKA